MIEAGVDMWCGQVMNDREKMYPKYGQQIKLGIIPPPFPKDGNEEKIRENVDWIINTFPKNAYVGMDFSVDPRYYPYLYEASRKAYN